MNMRDGMTTITFIIIIIILIWFMPACYCMFTLPCHDAQLCLLLSSFPSPRRYKDKHALNQEDDL